MNKSAFLRLPCFIPPYQEQQKIAKILDACDKVINLKEKLLAEKRRRKKWLLENLLDPDSGIRLPGFTGEWEEEKLSDTCHINALNLTENTNKDYGNRSRGIPYKTHVSSRIETVSARIY
jgi:type I restriction enzyme S subunit